ncbi:MAG TPA: tetratricopeptide repeat protein [Vicinamibacterales bacterium]|nr:tetratricopeptide repeat protein [Vicinamibacterales bacterium]
MRERIESPNDYRWIANAAALLLSGGLAGYIIAVEGGLPRPVPSAPASTATAVPGAVVDESQLRAYRDILARDPRNRQAAVGAGNLLYDAQRYQEAIGFYQQALAIEPSDIGVSTDLGTALWYAGRADEALAQYERSLTLSPTHAQTLFNVGIVRADGKHDYAGAIAAWETLLKTNPDYPAVTRVQSLMADARAKTSSTR